MKIVSTNYLNGWFIGNFLPNLIFSKEIEVGIKTIKKDTQPDYHYHKIKTEYTILLNGMIKCLSNNQIVTPGQTIIIKPYEKNDQLFIEESLIMLVDKCKKCCNHLNIGGLTPQGMHCMVKASQTIIF